MADENFLADLAELPDQATAPISPQQIVEALRCGATDFDCEFDRFLPLSLQRASAQHWTQLEVAVRVAGWIAEVGAKAVIDIGSGAGKFCVAAAGVGEAHYWGLEQRPRLVRAARALARAFDVADRVSFQCGLLGEVALPSADAYYLYNPFGENMHSYVDRLDHTVELSAERHARDVARVVALLRAAPVGSYLITYNGFGGLVPANYERHRVDYSLPSELRMWRKSSTTRPPGSPR